MSWSQSGMYVTGFCLQTVGSCIGSDHITRIMLIVVMVKCNSLKNVTVPASSWLTAFFCMAA